MPGLKETLTRKVGPLPVWAWGAAGIGGLLAARYLKTRQAAQVPTTGAGTAGDTFASGMGDSAIPVDVTGRAPLMSYSEVGGGGYPVPEPIFYPDPGLTATDGVPPTPDIAPRPVPVFQPPVYGKPTKPAGLGLYPDAPNRECPLGWHKAVSGPYRGLCIPNVGT